MVEHSYMTRQCKIQKTTRSPYSLIVKVHLKDFMVHRNFEWRPGHCINFITGKNGSGKSSLLQAIVLGLMSGTKHVGRYSRLGDFVRKGSQRATIAVTLHNTAQCAVCPLGCPCIHKCSVLYTEALRHLRHFQHDSSVSYTEFLYTIRLHIQLKIENEEFETHGIRFFSFFLRVVSLEKMSFSHILLGIFRCASISQIQIATDLLSNQTQIAKITTESISDNEIGLCQYHIVSVPVLSVPSVISMSNVKCNGMSWHVKCQMSNGKCQMSCSINVKCKISWNVMAFQM